MSSYVCHQLRAVFELFNFPLSRVTDIEVTDLSANALYPKVYNLRVTHSVHYSILRLGPAGVL